MSETIPPTSTPVTTINDSLRSPQFIIAMFGMTIAALTVVAVMLIQDLNALQGAIAGTVIATSMMPMGYYFGSSQGSQKKDQTIASMASPPAVETKS